MKKTHFKYLVSIVMVFCLLMTGVAWANNQDFNEYELDYFKSVMEMIKENYSGEITIEELVEGALKGMFDTMDDYTVYYTKQEAESFFSDVSGSYKGIGIMFSKYGQEVVVVKVFDSSPAQNAGIVAGDIIVEVDDVDITSKSTDEIASLIRGEEGTKVVLGIRRKDSDKLKRVVVMRKEIKISPGEYSIEGDIGYIKLEVFNSNTSDFISKALKEMDNNNIKKIILDLRDNPGGEVNQAVAVARKFVPKGLITRLEFKSEGLVNHEYKSYLAQTKYNVVVLVNEMSASAAEILAGAIQDTEAGVLVGTKTFGKAKVQNLFPILNEKAYRKYEKELGVSIVNGYELSTVHGITPSDDEIIGWTKITTGRYYTPNGRMIDGVGIEPDIFVDNNTYDIDLRSIEKLRKTVKPELNSESVDVYNAKKILKLSGYEVGDLDMLMDGKTFKSVAAFQKDEGLFPYGVLDFATQRALNKKLDELSYGFDRQYLKAVEILK
ncbi:UNVERIFIED_CONTAM: carboxyl-terminal processing protease [Acetivibrio alkalicellulosi]